jgi:disulfide bond formation protein DsbB
MAIVASTVPTMSLFFALLAVVAEVVVLAALVLWIGGRFSDGLARAGRSARESLGQGGLWLAWVVALTCTLGSLYLSEVAHFIPCKLCWYQRIAMYPLAVLLLVAAIKHSTEIARATLPLIAIGASISVYHYLLERFPSMSGAATCDPTAPCTIVWIWRFHYLSIPAMALSGFLLIATLILATPREHRPEE